MTLPYRLALRKRLFPQIHLTLIGMQGVGQRLFVIAQDQLGLAHIEALGGGILHIPVREGADHQDLLVLIGHGVHIELVRQGIMLPELAVADTA